MKKLLFFLTSFSAFFAAQAAQIPSPAETAARIAKQFLSTDPLRYKPVGFGGAGEFAKKGYGDDFNVHYSVVSLWVNAIECARKSGDFALVDELVRHFDSFYAENRQAQCTFRHVDYNVFGALPAEIFLVNGDKRAYAMAMDFAERQWEKPGPRDPQPWYDVRELGERMNWWKQGYSAQTRLWIDDMYMITFLQSQAYRITGKKIYLERAAKEMVLYLSRIQLKNGLFHHSPEAPFAWARGNGWMAAAMTLLLEYLPKDAPERAEVEAGFKLMMATLLANQREGGLWGQIVDDEGSWDETSGSAMFAYAFQSGCNMNLLGPEYGKAAAKAYAALVAKLDANANIADVCEGTGPKDSREWYLGRGRVNGDPHGQAPLLWLCSAMLDKTLQQPCRTVENIVYRPDLKTENCRLKMKLPEKGNGFATLVWFHGGGLKGGRPGFLSLNDDSIAQVAVKYRFLGETDAEGCIEDAAAAIAWTVKNIAKYGGDPKKVFVAGHSAGGYLALMSVLDPKRLAKHGIDNTALAGVIPVSGQVTAHFNVREFSGDCDHRFLPKIDALSPLSLCANPMPPVFLVVGDRKLDIPCRAEENELMAASLKAIGKKRVCFREFPERNHVSVLGPAKVAMRDYITRTVSEITPPFRTADMLVKAHKLRKAGDDAAALAVENAVKKYAILDVPGFYTLYAKEVLADGTQVIGDDGKLPNLMSLPFYCDVLRNDSNYINTRRLALNDKNPWVLRNDDGDWLVDPFTGKVSPEALVMRALTSGNDAEIRRVMKQYSSSGIKNAKSEELFAELVKRLKNAGREDLIAAAAKERTQRERVALAAESVAKAAAKKHPRLFGSAEDFEAIKRNAKTDARLAAAVARVISDADGYLKVAPVKPQKVGYRILGECRKAMTRMATLGMAWRLTGKRRYVERADRELDGIASFKDWNPGHFLDVAEMTMAVSFYYDWMYDAISPERRAQAERLVAEKGFGADGPDAFWTVLQNNWVQVCHAGMLSAAIAFADVHGDSARAFVAGMLKTLPEAMCAVAPDGCYPEGPMYWSYGMTFNVFALAMCESAFGSTLALDDEPGFRETASFPELMTGPSGRFFNFSDSGDRRSQMPALWWLSRRFDRPDLVGGIEGRLFDAASAQRGVGMELENRVARDFPVSLLWYRPVPAGTESRTPDVWVARGPMPVAVQCSGREDPDCTYVGLKGGSPSFNHGHKDGGSFVLDMLGERWVEDPGRENYSKVEAQLGGRFWAPENDSPRWEVFRLGTQGHNVFMINSRQQDSAGEAVIESFQTGAVSRVVMDLRTLYPELEKAKRTSALDSVSRRWTVSDELVGIAKGDEIAWGFNTRAEVSVLGKTVTLAQNGKKVSVEMDVNAKGVWTVAPAKGKFACESENPGLKRVVFVCKATDRAVHMTVTFTPRGGGKPALVALPPPVARVRPRLAGESKPGRWTIGCEVLDRELAIFSGRLQGQTWLPQ